MQMFFTSRRWCFFEEYKMCCFGISEPSKTLICCIEVRKATSRQQNVAFHEQLFPTLWNPPQHKCLGYQALEEKAICLLSNTPVTVNYNTNKPRRIFSIKPAALEINSQKYVLIQQPCATTALYGTTTKDYKREGLFSWITYTAIPSPNPSEILTCVAAMLLDFQPQLAGVYNSQVSQQARAECYAFLSNRG